MRRPVVLVVATGLLSGCSFGLVGTGTGPALDTGALVEEMPRTAVPLDGKLYRIARSDVKVVEPPGLDELREEFLDRDVLVYVESETEDAIQLAVSLAAKSGTQDPCEAVRRFPTADWSANPVFDVGPGELTTSFGGHPATFRDLELAGTFDEYAFAWYDGTLAATLDTRELVGALPDGTDACALVESLDGACEPCDDGEEACFALRIEQITAEMVEAEFDPDNDGASCAR